MDTGERQREHHRAHQFCGKVDMWQKERTKRQQHGWQQLHPSTDMPRNAKGLTLTKDSEKGAKFQRDTGHEGTGMACIQGKGRILSKVQSLSN